MTASSLHFVSRLFTAACDRSLNRRLGLEPWEINPVIFIRVGHAIALWHKAGALATSNVFH